MPRLKGRNIMNKIINGKSYNTDKAKRLARWDNGMSPSDFEYYTEALYVKKTGEYFLYGEGGGNSKYGEWHGNSGGPGEAIEPLTLSDAKKWAERLDGDEYESIFGDIEEAPDNTDQQLISMLLPIVILDALKAKKEATGMNVSSLIVKALRDAGYGNQ